MRPARTHVTIKRGASALVLSGELTEGVSDLSQAMTAPGGVPALREVNQDRSHPDSPLIEEQPRADYRQIVHGGGSPSPGAAWVNVSPPGRAGSAHGPGPAQAAYDAHVSQNQSRAERDRNG